MKCTVTCGAFAIDHFTYTYVNSKTIWSRAIEFQFLYTQRLASFHDQSVFDCL